MILRFFPAYSPDLNPVERWNNIFKGKLRKSTCIKKEQIDIVADNFIKPYNNREKTAQVKKLFHDKKCDFILSEAIKGHELLDRYNRLYKITA